MAPYVPLYTALGNRLRSPILGNMYASAQWSSQGDSGKRRGKEINLIEVLTIAGEHGNGAAELGHLDVLKLEWELVGGQLVGVWHAFSDKSSTPCSEKEVFSCHLPLHL